MIDLAQLQQLIDTTPAEGRPVIIKRGWLEQLMTEIREGRVAKGQLAQVSGMAAVTASIETGARS